MERPPRSRRWLADNDLAGDEGGCLLRRVVEAAGRSRGFINGRAATLAQLRELGELLVDIHGQHEHQSLARRRRAARAAGCASADSRTLPRRSRGFTRTWQQRRESRVTLETNAAAFAAEREQLDWQVRELERSGSAPDEWPELDAEHTPARACGEPDRGRAAWRRGAVRGRRRRASRSVNTMVGRGSASSSSHDPGLKEILELLEPARIQLQEAAHALRRYGERLELDPQRLREVEQRLDAVHAAARKYRVQPEELPEKLAAARRG